MQPETTHLVEDPTASNLCWFLWLKTSAQACGQDKD